MVQDQLLVKALEKDPIHSGKRELLTREVVLRSLDLVSRNRLLQILIENLTEKDAAALLHVERIEIQVLSVRKDQDVPLMEIHQKEGLKNPFLPQIQIDLPAPTQNPEPNEKTGQVGLLMENHRKEAIKNRILHPDQVLLQVQIGLQVPIQNLEQTENQATIVQKDQIVRLMEILQKEDLKSHILHQEHQNQVLFLSPVLNQERA